MRGFLSAMVLAALLSFVLLSGYACTPTDAGTGNNGGQQQTDATTPNSGGFTLEDTAVVDVDIQDNK